MTELRVSEAVCQSFPLTVLGILQWPWWLIP
jgi:hypothetical protein